MPRIANITLTAVGTDPGPYNIITVDNSSNETIVASNISQATLLGPGYSITIADNIVLIVVVSVNPACEDNALEIDVPPIP